MPFNIKALEDLMKRESLSPRRLSEAIHDNNHKDLISHQAIYDLLKDKHPPKTTTLDMLHRYARSKGHKDLEFYTFPD